VADDWLHGRGAGDMKGGLVCALLAFKALREMGLQPAGIVGFNAVLDEESTGNGTLATLQALRAADAAETDGVSGDVSDGLNGQAPSTAAGPGLGALLAKARLSDFDAVLIPEPFGETLMAAQVGVCWLFVQITGRPAHVAYRHQGINPIEAGIAVVADLKLLEAEWNAADQRPPLYRDVVHPLNVNLGRIDGGEWNSSVHCTCTLGLRISFFPGVSAAQATRQVSERIRANAARVNPALTVEISARGHFSPGCDDDLDAPAMQALAEVHRQINGQLPARLACTATTDGRHFALMTDIPFTVYGPLARNIHRIDEAVSLASMSRVAATMAGYIADWCGVETLAPPAECSC
jgi:acetylornithine deacetylase